MERLKWIRHLAIILLFACCQKPKPEPPNILFVMMDDLGYGHLAIHNDSLVVEDFDPKYLEHVEEYGNYDPEEALQFSKIATPTMTKLAREGIIFTRAYTSSSLCAPSRLGIATGILQNRLGVYRNTDCEARGLDPGSHLVEKINDKGYATAHIGKWHIGRRRNQMILDALQRNGVTDTLSYFQIRGLYPEIFKELVDAGYYGSVVDEHNPINNGFDYYFGYNNWASQFYNSTFVWENFEHAGKQQGYNTDVFTDTAIAFIQRSSAQNQPFYVQIHYHAVHDSLHYKAPDKYFNKFSSTSYDLNNFYAHVNAVDQSMQRIVDSLKSIGEYENTLIVFTSDNGAQSHGPSVMPGNAPFPGHKGSYFQGGIRVPMFFHWPDGISDGTNMDILSSTMDILPTAIAAAGGEAPSDIDGRSLLPQIMGISNQPVRDHLIWAGMHSRAWGFLLSTTFETHGSERQYAPPAWVVIKDNYILRYVGEIEPDLYKEAPDGGPPVLQLYDFHEDPGETTNLSQVSPEIVKELSQLYIDQAVEFPPPVDWERSKWVEIMPKDNPYLDPGRKIELF